MLGSIFFFRPMRKEKSARDCLLKSNQAAALLVFFVCLVCARAKAAPQRQVVQAGQGVATLEADQQREVGKIFYADGNVTIRYKGARLHADHVEYNDQTGVAVAHGHVQFDYQNQHIDADAAQYDLAAGTGSFRNVSGTITAQRRPNPNLLLSPNPLYFQAAEVRRVDEFTYEVRHAWVTVCRPDRPKWKFYAPRATIHLRRSVTLENATFRLFTVPVIYLPFASTPAGRKVRQSGFLIPDAGHSSIKGFVFGDSYYWAPTEWMDAMVGAQYMSLRGWSQTGDLRLRPWENATLGASYFGVIDRGLPSANGTRIKEGGHEAHFNFESLLPEDWRAVAVLDQLSSLTFRLAFSETFNQAVNSEVRNTAFLTKHSRGFTVDFAALSYKNFLSVSPETSIELRTAPEGRMSSVPQAPWKRLPVYFSFDLFEDATNRSDTVPPAFQTPEFVQRTEFAPEVTIPLRFGLWLGLTPSFTLRSTRYGAQLENGVSAAKSFLRTTEEFTLDLRPPSLEHIWERAGTNWKHVIEPQVVYRYVNGVNDFGRFIRFDEDDTLTDTNEVEYSLMQRLFRRSGSGDAEELLSWRLAQKYFFDPTFGEALVPGQRNVFQALDSLTPFAFADSLHRFSPIISDLRITPGRHYDAQFRVDYDPKRGRATAWGELLNLHPYRESFISLAHFSTINLPPTSSTTMPSVFSPRSNQVRALVGYGDLNRRGWNTAFGLSYDVAQKVFQNQLVQISYNGSCCGIGFEFRRLALGTIRSENQFRVVLSIANIGSFGNLRRQEKIF